MKLFIMKAWDYFQLDMKLKYKFYTVYIICTVIPFALLALSAGNTIYTKTKVIIMDSVYATLEQTCDLLSAQLDKVISVTQSIYLDTALYTYLSAQDVRPSSLSHSTIEKKLETLSAEKGILNVQLYLVDESKLNHSKFRCLGLSAARHAGWYIELQERGLNSIWWKSTDNEAIYYVRKMYSSSDRHTLIGYIVVAFSQSTVANSLQNLCYTDNSIVCVLDQNSPVLSVDQKRGQGLRDVSAIVPNDETGLAECTIHGVKYCVVSKYLPKYKVSSMPQWDVVLLTPFDELFISLKTVMINITLTASGCLVILLLIASAIIGNITKRIEKVSDNMKLIQAGDFTSNEDSCGRDEISVLRSNFNYMLKRTKRMLKQTVEAHERAKDLELNMLQSQINPHFLYNTLDLINWVALSKSTMEIPEITNMLARFYKLSLKKGVRIVRLSDEIEHIRLYTALQNKRYDDAISLKINVPAEHQDCACVKILLQPIVENAVLHGIMERDIIQGNIWIHSDLDGDDLIIVVRDDGIGMDLDTLDALNQKAVWIDENGYGIKNTMDRIALCYGPKYGLHYESEHGVGTVVKVRIPYIRYKDDMKHNARLRK